MKSVARGTRDYIFTLRNIFKRYKLYLLKTRGYIVKEPVRGSFLSRERRFTRASRWERGNVPWKLSPRVWYCERDIYFNWGCTRFVRTFTFRLRVRGSRTEKRSFNPPSAIVASTFRRFSQLKFNTRRKDTQTKASTVIHFHYSVSKLFDYTRIVFYACSLSWNEIKIGIKIETE